MPTDRNRSDLAQFLRSRRERITPVDVGLPVGPRRRTPGLRREEIAVLAGLSPTWYTYLEQGRDIRPSPEVLESLSRVLQLSEDERHYVYMLANGQAPPASPAPPPDVGEDIMKRVVELVGDIDTPVYAANIYADMVAWNAATEHWYADFAAMPPDRRNMLWWMLTAPEARSRIMNWAEDTRDVTARFRHASATRPADSRFTELIARMRAASPEFCHWWSEHDVRGQRVRPRCLRLPSGEQLTAQLVVLRQTASINSIVLHVPVSTEEEATNLARSFAERISHISHSTLSTR